jgi:hypothetical protein
VPRDWIAPPDYDNADGELLDDEDDDDERTRILRKEQWRRSSSRVSEEEQQRWNSEMDRIGEGSRSTRRSYGLDQKPRVVALLRDSSGREMPASERSPLPRRMTYD